MCWKCHNKIDPSVEIFRGSECSFCGTDLHSCRNCRFFSPGSHHDCHETVEELVVDKEKANFCDFFKAQFIFSSIGKNNDTASEAREAFSKLFNK